MGVTKTGRTYRARHSFKSIRHNIGTFKTRKEAETALRDHMARNCMEYEIPKQPILARVKHAINTIRTSASSKKR